MNQYAYCENDPVNGSDPSGLITDEMSWKTNPLKEGDSSWNGGGEIPNYSPDGDDDLTRELLGGGSDDSPPEGAGEGVVGSGEGVVGSGGGAGDSTDSGGYPGPAVGSGGNSGAGDGQGGLGPPVIIGTGKVDFDDDGTGTIYGPSTHVNHASAMMGDGGGYVPRYVPKYLPNGGLNPSKYAERLNPLGKRDLNADIDSYGVAPSILWNNGKGPLEVGDRMVGIFAGGRIDTVIGDFGPPNGFGEFSIKALKENGFNLQYARGGYALRFGKNTANIPITVYFYPNTH